MSTDTKNGLRADTRQVTPAEGKAFGALLEEIGFAPNVMFGREGSHLPTWFRRLIEGKVYAIVPIPRGPNAQSDVTKYTLLTAPVGGAEASNGMTPMRATSLRRAKGQQAAWTPERREKMRRTMKALWAAKRTVKTLE